jgi:hypothetical protein
MLKNIFISMFCFITMSILFGCNEQSPVAGGILIDDSTYVTVLSSDSVPFLKTATGFNTKPSASYLNSLFIGSSKGFQASILARFGNIPDSLAGAEIVSATLKLQPERYVFGDSVANRLAFSVYSVNKLWAPDATIDTLSQNGFIDAKSIANYDGIIPLKDTMSSISIDIDKSFISQWFTTKSNTKSDSLIYGVALIPTMNSTVIRAFARNTISSPEKSPVLLQVLYKKSGSQTIDSVLLISAYDGCFVKSPLQNDGSIVLDCASGQVSELGFNLSAVPKNVSVHGAVLTLQVNASQCITGNRPKDTVITANFVDSSTANILREYYAVSSSSSTEYTFSVLNSVIEGILRRGTNGILKILPYVDRDRNRVDRLVFYGPNDPDPTKRPKLKIVYSNRPKP